MQLVALMHIENECTPCYYHHQPFFPLALNAYIDTIRPIKCGWRLCVCILIQTPCICICICVCVCTVWMILEDDIDREYLHANIS